MNKVFKASLIAVSVATMYGAHAATVTSTPFKLSAEGVAAGLEQAGATLVLDIAVEQDHPAASTITLTFDDTVTLDPNVGCVGTVTNDPNSGTGTCGTLTFSYGTGSFTFDNVETDVAAGTISFDVNLGNPLTANSAFRIDLGATSNLSGAATVAYSSETSGGVAIETGTGVVATTESQFDFTVVKKFDGIVNRLDRDAFVKNALSTTTDDSDHNFVNKNTLGAALPGIGLSIAVNGSFGDTLSADWTGTIAGTPKVLTVVNAGPLTGAANPLDIDFGLITPNADIPLSDFTATVSVTTTEAGVDPIVIVSNADIGGFALDASVVNVPYLPVGYGLTAQVEIANLGDTDAEVMIEAVDQDGVEYGPVALDFTYGGETFTTARAGTVTRASEADIRKAFGGLAEDSRKKLSITFVVDADADDITLVPLYRQNESRINVISDQYKGKIN